MAIHFCVMILSRLESKGAVAFQAILTPLVAVALEWALFGVVPTPLSALGIGVTCAGVALVARRR